MKRIFRKKQSMNWRIFCITTLIIAFSILMIGGFVYNYFRSIYSKSTDKAMELVMQKYSSTVVDYFWRAEALGDIMKMENTSFFPGIEKETDARQNYKTYLRLEEKIKSYCESIFGQEPEYSCYLFLCSEYPISKLFHAPDSSLLYKSTSAESAEIRIFSDLNLKKESWFQEASQNTDSAYWFTAPDNGNIVLTACNLRDVFLVNDKVQYYSLGTLVLRFNISAITEYFDNDNFGANLKLYITDSEYRILYADDTSILNKKFYELTEDINHDESITIKGIHYRFWEQELPNAMHLLFLFPVQFYNEQLWSNLQLIILLFMVVLLAEVIFTAIFSRIITRPIDRLSNHMKNSNTLTAIQHDYQAEDEIGVLYHTFNDMVAKNKLLIQQIYEYAEQQKQLEYQKLQAQINPHFMYNTLDSVSCVAMIKGENELSMMLSSLAVMLRYNINNPEQLVTLREELRMVDNYIAIQQFRSDNGIRYSCMVVPKLEEIRLPKTILQPLVENGIQYGRINDDGYRYISISAEFSEATENIIHIRICNEMHGMECMQSANVKQLNSYLNGDFELHRKNSGLGILNVQQRIRLVYGDEYGIHYEHHGEQIAAVIEIPFCE